jgi:hypothetical protein
MRTQLSSSILIMLFSLGALPIYAQYTDAGADPVPTVQKLLHWEQCREYLPSKKSPQCRIDFDMAQTKDIRVPPQTHKDITVYLSRDSRGLVVLWRSSPFAACSLTTTPGPFARDLSANISTALTSMAGLGAIPQATVTGPVNASALQPAVGLLSETMTETELSALSEQEKIKAQSQNPNLRGPKLDEYVKQKTKQQELEEERKRRERNELLAKIQKDEGDITAALKDFAAVAAPYQSLYPDSDDVEAIRQAISYSYPDDQTARERVKTIYDRASQFVSRPLPDAKSPPALAAKLDVVVTLVDKLEKTYPDNEIHEFVVSARKQIDTATEQLKSARDAQTAVLVTYLNDATSKINKLIDFIHDWIAQDAARTRSGNPTDASAQVLPIALYSESKVAIQVKCTDPVTSATLFDSIQFNAYFQSPPIFDISSGLLISTVHGRQAATQATYTNPSSPTSCPANPTAIPPTTSNCPVVIINKTRPQFMPGVFAELHWLNFKLPGVHETADEPGNPPARIPTWMSQNAPRHPFGYVGSIGLAGGILVNPNNGTTQAEFFEGISFGIQRFVFLIGNHTARSQNLTGGYYVGAPVTAGTTPATVLNWSNGLAFGITYRIPLR